MLRKKWKMFGAKIFLAQFLQYVFFLTSITGYTLSKLTYDRFKDMNTADIKANAEEDRNRVIMPEVFTSSPTIAVTIFRIASFGAIGLGLLIEVSQIIRSKARYVNLRNLVDWLLYLLSILLLLDIGVYEVGEDESPSTYLETKGCSGRTVRSKLFN